MWEESKDTGAFNHLPWRALLSSQRATVLSVVEELARLGGELLSTYLYEPALAKQREEADLKVEQLLRTKLTSYFPTWGFRAEEEPDQNTLAKDGETFWLVDPNDGTSSFLRGERGASVSIGLIAQGVPVLGVIFAYAAPNAQGDLFSWAEGCGPLRRNTHAVRPEWTDHWDKSTLFISNSADLVAEAYQQVLSTDQGSARYRVAPGIAYRLALCAAGEGDLAISLASPRDFDFAAGHALLRGVGGDWFDERGESVRYHIERPQRLGYGFGGSALLVQEVLKLDWMPVFEAKRNQQVVPFIKPEEVSLCDHAWILDRAQGMWWGWHIGHAKAREDEDHDALSILQADGGDLDLVVSLRRYLRVETRTQLDQAAKRSVQVFIDRMSHELQELKQGVPAMSEDETAQASGDLFGMKWGGQLGRQRIPTKYMKALLSFRKGDMERWQPDGDRMIELLLAELKWEKLVSE